MSLAQNRLVLAASLLSGSAWLYAVFGMAGLAFGLDGSPLGLLAVLAILSFSLVIARSLDAIVMPAVVATLIHVVAGVIVLYLTLGTQVGSGGQGIDLGWVGNLSSETAENEATRKAVLASFFAVLLWWRGGRMAASEDPTDSLGFSFRLGVLALSAAAIVDISHSADLNVFPLMFMFFAAGLAGLSIGHVLPASQRTVEEKAWARVIVGVVSVVLVIGLMFSLIHKNVLSAVSDAAAVVFGAVGQALFIVLIFPFAFVINAIVSGLFGLLQRLFGGEPREPDPQGAVGFEGLQERAEEAGDPAFLGIIEWVVVAIIVMIALYILARAFRRRVKWRWVQAEGMRESVREAADPAYDLAQLLFNLLPDRFKRAKRPHTFDLPEDDADVVDVFRVYFALLVLAEELGFPRPRTETPTEFARTLEKIFPQDLVRKATAAFVRACYGHQPAPRHQIDEMRASLDRLASEAR